MHLGTAGLGSQYVTKANACFLLQKSKVFSTRILNAISSEKKHSATVLMQYVQTAKGRRGTSETLSLPKNSKSTPYRDTSTDPDLRPKLLAAMLTVGWNVASVVCTSDWFLVNLVIMSRACIGTSIGTCTIDKDLLHD